MTATGPLPVDRALPGLATVQREGLPTVLRRLDLHGEVQDLRVLRYRVGQRCTFQVTLSRTVLVVKAYAEDPMPIVRLHRRMAEQGLASRRGATVAPLLGSDRQRCLLAFEWLDGPSAEQLVRDGRDERAGWLASDWLWRAAGVRTCGGERHGPDTVLEEARTAAQQLTDHDPHLGAIATRRVEELAAAVPAKTPRSGLVHGRYAPCHVLDQGSGAGVIDWDRFGVGPVELDAGHFLARLARRGDLGADDDRHVVARRSFRSGLVGLVDFPTLDWYQAGAMIRVASRLVVRRRRRALPRAATVLRVAGDVLKGHP
jgi:hypothetical protein